MHLSEESELGPTWDYPKSKVETELAIREKQGHIPAVILRIAGVYTDLCQSIPIAHQIQRIYENKLEGHLYSGDIGAKQSFVHLVCVFRHQSNTESRLNRMQIPEAIECGFRS